MVAFQIILRLGPSCEPVVRPNLPKDRGRGKGAVRKTPRAHRRNEILVPEPVPSRGHELVQRAVFSGLAVFGAHGVDVLQAGLEVAEDGRGQLHFDRLPAAPRHGQRHH